MNQSGFFQTTRGRILESLKREGNRTAADLAREHALTPNAVRQHLSRLEADGLITEATARRGRTKPSLIYRVTPSGERLFPHRYDVLLKAVLHELKLEEGEARVSDLFRKIGQRSARKYAGRFEGKDAAARVGEFTKLLQEQGVVAECERTDIGFVIREHTCPFKENVAENPQICTVVHTLMNELLPSAPRQTRSIARGDDVCEFQIASADKSGESYGLS
jgi:DeoR family transcriptional regulator, suf operon transcriptional repressor